jgi:hypothetical protein
MATLQGRRAATVTLQGQRAPLGLEGLSTPAVLSGARAGTASLAGRRGAVVLAGRAIAYTPDLDTYALLTEAGDILTTEAGDTLVLEAA